MSIPNPKAIINCHPVLTTTNLTFYILLLPFAGGWIRQNPGVVLVKSMGINRLKQRQGWENMR